MTKKMMSHNMPPKVIDDFLILNADGNSTGRINITNTIMSKNFVRKINATQETYVAFASKGFKSLNP